MFFSQKQTIVGKKASSMALDLLTNALPSFCKEANTNKK